MPGRDFLPCAGPLGTFIAVLAGALAMLVFAANYHFMAQRREGNGGPFPTCAASSARITPASAPGFS